MIHNENLRKEQIKSTSLNTHKKISKKLTTTVFYVEKKNTKSLKNALETRSLIDKRFRITKAVQNAPVHDPKLYMAIPVVDSIWNEARTKSKEELKSSWLSIVVATGEQEIMYSSAVLGQMR